MSRGQSRAEGERPGDTERAGAGIHLDGITASEAFTFIRLSASLDVPSRAMSLLFLQDLVRERG